MSGQFDSYKHFRDLMAAFDASKQMRDMASAF